MEPSAPLSGTVLPVLPACRPLALGLVNGELERLSPMPHRYLDFTPQDRRLLVELGTHLAPFVDRIVAEVEAALRDAEEIRPILPADGLHTALRHSLVDYVAALGEDRIDAYLTASAARIREGAEQGVPYDALVVAIMALQSAVGAVLAEAFADAPATVAAVRPAFGKAAQRHLALAANAYLAGKEETIRDQHAAMRALSTPVVEIWQGVLALPLVGTIDTGRAQQITQNLLRAICDTQARVVILDISGVPIVDTRVANHLMKTVRAARLLGAQGIVVGISPEIADTLVSLDVTLEGIATYFSLRQGLEAALAMLDLEVVPRGAR